MHRACAAFVAGWGVTSSSPTRTPAHAEPYEGVKARTRRISDFTVGEVVDGRVAFRKDNGAVFVDIGSFGNALLIAPNRLRSQLRPDEILKDLSVEVADQKGKRLVVKVQNPEKLLEEREEAASGGETANAGGQAKQKTLSEFSVGDVIAGRVAAKVKGVGVFLDVGAVKPALLIAPYNRAIKLKPNRMLHRLRVTEVDLERRRLGVTLPDQEDMDHPEKGGPVASADAADAGPGAAAAAVNASSDAKVSTKRPLADFCVGDRVDGRVARKKQGVGVFLDIGAARLVRLDAPYKLCMKLKPKQILRDLFVSEVDLEKHRLSVTLPFSFTRKPVSDFSVGDVVNGSVAFKQIGVGAFVQIGAVKTALLFAPYELAMKLELNDTLPGLRVEKVDPERERILVTFSDLEAWIRERDTAAASSTAIGSGGSVEDGAPQAGPRPLTDFSVDDVVDGRVVFKKEGVGVFVDIGAARTALLLGPYSLAMRLKPNTTLQGLRLQEVDLDRGRLAVTFPPGLETRYKPISDFSVGDVIDGEVAFKKGGVGVFVDVGAVENAPLLGPKGLALKLKPKEALKDLRVEKVDLERNLLVVAYPDLERHVEGRR